MFSSCPRHESHGNAPFLAKSDHHHRTINASWICKRETIRPTAGCYLKIIKQTGITEQSVLIHASSLSLSLAASLSATLPLLSRRDYVNHLAGKYTHLTANMLGSVCGTRTHVSFLLPMRDDGGTAVKHTVDFLHI